MKRVFVHMIADDDLMRELSVATKLVPSPFLLKRLKEAGRAAAGTFLDDHKQALNRRCTVEMAQMYG